MTRRFLVAAALLVLAAPSLARAEDKIDPAKMTKTASGLRYKDVKTGQGASPARGQTCVMHYTGWLWEDGRKGKKFDSSHDRGQPFDFAIGEGNVIKGWDEGVATMKTGGKRLLLIPPPSATASRGPAASSRRTRRCCSRWSCWASSDAYGWQTERRTGVPKDQRSGFLVCRDSKGGHSTCPPFGWCPRMIE
jgi:peptidylprolyl isomerase